jgi:Tfp pilus assembly protein PilO
MDKRVEELYNQLPTFADLNALVERIGSLSKEDAYLKVRIDEVVSEVVKISTSNEKYFVGGKPPTMAYIERTYAITGIEGVNLAELRKKLATVSAELEKAKLQFRAYQQMYAIWQTLSANVRKDKDMEY